MRVEQKAAATYWAQMWNWVGSSDGGYLGLQTSGSRFNGTSGDTAIFSLWNANAARGPSCGQFGGEGNGYSCRLAYSISTSPFYRYRVWRQNADAGGQWWGAWIQNLSTGTDTYIGSIRVAAGRSAMTNVQNFVEYFGTAKALQPRAGLQGGVDAAGGEQSWERWLPVRLLLQGDRRRPRWLHGRQRHTDHRRLDQGRPRHSGWVGTCGRSCPACGHGAWRRW